MIKKKQKSATLEDIIKALALDEKKAKSDTHSYGEVKSINQDGSYNVALNGANITTRCARLVGAKVGDTVFVTIMKNGFAVVTNTLGGDGDAAAALAAFKIKTITTESFVVEAGTTYKYEEIISDIPDGYVPLGLISLKQNTGPVGVPTMPILGWDIVSDQDDYKLQIWISNGSNLDMSETITVTALFTSLDVS